MVGAFLIRKRLRRYFSPDQDGSPACGVEILHLPPLTRGIRAAWHRLRPEPHFRDPFADFGIAVTAPEALAVQSTFRMQHGPYLTEHGSYLALHFGRSTTDGVHAIMNRNAPLDLVFSYTQIMAGFSSFVPQPRTIGMLGLGGGSLPKHCYHHFAETRITVAEISPEVIALRRQFLIPDDDTRFTVLQMDGLDFVTAHTEAFDVLLVDAFDEGGYLPRFGTRSFYRACQRALTPNGVLVLNFSGEAWQAASQALLRTFRNRNVLYLCPDGNNIIAFATRGPLPAWTAIDLAATSRNDEKN